MGEYERLKKEREHLKRLLSKTKHLKGNPARHMVEKQLEDVKASIKDCFRK